MTARKPGRPRKTETLPETRIITRAVGYIRVSSVGQSTEGFSLDEQRRRITAQAETHGWELVHIYVDAAQSGKTTDRAALTEMLDAADRGAFDAIIITKLDRLTRSLGDLLALDKRLAAAGVALVSIGESIDTSTPMGRFFRNVLGSIAELERETIVARVSSGQREKVRQGKRVGGRLPYGYRPGPNGTTAVDDTTAPIVRRIFAERAAQQTYQSIVDGLNADGIAGPGTNGAWTLSTVVSMLNNPYYGGMVRFGARSTSKRPAIIETATDHPAIVDPRFFVRMAA